MGMTVDDEYLGGIAVAEEQDRRGGGPVRTRTLDTDQVAGAHLRQGHPPAQDILGGTEWPGDGVFAGRWGIRPAEQPDREVALDEAAHADGGHVVVHAAVGDDEV